MEQQERVNKDISKIKDIFVYINRTAKRIGNSLEMDLHPRRKHPLKLEDISEEGGVDLDRPTSLHFEEYENMTESERAVLLEQAIHKLSAVNTDNSSSSPILTDSIYTTDTKKGKGKGSSKSKR